MIIKIDKSFEKDTNKIKDKSILAKIADCIENAVEANKLSEINDI